MKKDITNILTNITLKNNNTSKINVLHFINYFFLAVFSIGIIYTLFLSLEIKESIRKKEFQLQEEVKKEKVFLEKKEKEEVVIEEKEYLKLKDSLLNATFSSSTLLKESILEKISSNRLIFNNLTRSSFTDLESISDLEIEKVKIPFQVTGDIKDIESFFSQLSSSNNYFSFLNNPITIYIEDNNQIKVNFQVEAFLKKNSAISFNEIEKNETTTDLDKKLHFKKTEEKTLINKEIEILIQGSSKDNLWISIEFPNNIRKILKLSKSSKPISFKIYENGSYQSYNILLESNNLILSNEETGYKKIKSVQNY